MKKSPTHRTSIVMALYFCVLFNVLSCGIGHGQALGMALNGIGGSYCSLGSNASALSDQQDSALSAADWGNLFTCPMGSASLLVLVFLIAVAWLLARANRPAVMREVRSQAPPRYCWPSANPRASPF
ncbi:hypothetical protein ASF84_09925 [Pseudomonas sp. Leaf127]|uniref:DUF2946 domain-containing protein n=1 Tax=Pseudomonas sp. Leaf127 TaxID=1736267 RepID=UPI000702B379|nr:DUF2946 domain-containing protein [Pseudomonas sp. Leaf127]KQQ55647.1 hypothetical protein ASF84_09925 [Pseudomonas sp. Leaf127]